MTAINKLQEGYCQTHQRQACVVDLSLSQLLCEKCALYDPLYKHHEFIDRDSLPSHVTSLFQQLQQEINSLHLTIKDKQAYWQTGEELAAQALNNRQKDINIMYDEMIAEIQAERKNKLDSLAQEINSIMAESNEEINEIVREKYQSLEQKISSIQNCLNQTRYLEATKLLEAKEERQVISQLQKDLTFIELNLKQKLGFINVSPVPDLNLLRNRTSTKEELLLFTEEPTCTTFEIKNSSEWQTDRYPMKTVFNSETTLVPQTQRCPTVYSKDLNCTASSIDFNDKNTKTISNKADLKNPIIKNNIKNIVAVGLGLKNRQALEAVKKFSEKTMVTRIDLSQNVLTYELIVQLKRQKNLSKNLKRLVLRGIKLEGGESALKKEGINFEQLKEGQYKIGNISLKV